MTTYDVHQHLWPEAFIDALRSRTQPPFLDGCELVTVEGRFPAQIEAHDPGERARQLDRDGIDVAILSLQPTLGLDLLPSGEREELEDVWSSEILELVGTSESRFVALSPSVCRDGFPGISVGASSLLDVERTAEALHEAAERGLFVFVHPDAIGPVAPRRPEWWEWIVGYAERMQAAYLWWIADGRDRFPGLRALFAMLAGGAPFQLERLTRQGVDVRSTLDPHTYFEVATHGRRAIELCIETFGVAQIAYGSDTPVVDAAPTLSAVRGFGDAVVHVLQIETPAALLT